MQPSAHATPGDQPAGRVGTPETPRGTKTVQGAAQWLRQSGLEDDNYDGRQWWEESDSDSDEDGTPSRSSVVVEQETRSPVPSERNSDDEPGMRLVQPSGANSSVAQEPNRWQKHLSNMAYVQHINESDLMPAPLLVNKRKPVSRKPVQAMEKPLSSTNDTALDVDKPLPALPDMRLTGEMANGVKILSLADAQSRHKVHGYEMPLTEKPKVQQGVEAFATPRAPVRRGTTKRLLSGITKLTASIISSSGASSTASTSNQTPPPAPAQAPPTPPTTRSPTRVGNANRLTRWEDFMDLSSYEPSPSRPPPPPPTKEAKCNCPEHRAERATTYTVPRKPVPTSPEPLHSPSTQNEINHLDERMQYNFAPDDTDYEQELVVDTFVRAGHTSIRITDRVDHNTVVSHYGREERLDGDENVEKAKAKWIAYHEAKRLGLNVKTPSPTITTFR